ncbi:MAG: DUF1003 domain-containing protein [Terriglobia bacterium]|nr:MAG: DUF1003 domain-containing protein [Terriglobia bacterium]
MGSEWEESNSASEAIRQNIESVAKLEEDSIRNRTLPERIADAIGGFAGSLKFVVLHIAVYGFWIGVNIHAVQGIPQFDPFPFPLLNMSVSIEAIFLATFVLIKQNRMSRRADQRAHLDLQINLLAEREMTLVLQLLERIAKQLGVPHASEEIQDLAKQTSVEAVVTELLDKIPDQ